MIITHQQIIIFFLIFARFLGLIIAAPIFSRKEFFTFGKVTFLFWISGLFLMIIPTTEVAYSYSLTFVCALILDFMIGILLGFTLDLPISSIELGGNIIDTQAGLSVAALLNPSTGRQETILSILLKQITLLFFLIIDGHHFLISVLVQSFEVIPVGSLPNISNAALTCVKFAAYIFLTAVKIAAPIMLVVFMIDFGMGILNKLAEQINIFQLGFQVKPIVSIIIFLALIPGIADLILKVLNHSSEEIIVLLKTIKV